ncbi:hypothetical protein MKW94_010470 [Papaver nudicaule]|uniref:Ribosomal protein S12 n=1 Tax=Papaver nudicaule TaxID=74823 RepID=A0AA41S669_PAPNU|nr:hypothetical protein [Papaver nudicaule]
MLGCCVQHSYLCCVDIIGHSGKQLRSNGNSSLLDMRPLQHSGNAFQRMCQYPLLKQGNHYRNGVERNVFIQEKNLFSRYPFSSLSGLEKDSCCAQQSDACVIDNALPATGQCQRIAASPSSILSPAYGLMLIFLWHHLALDHNLSEDGLVYVSGPTYASSTVAASSISYNPPPVRFGHHSIPTASMGFCAFRNVAARRVQHICFATISQLIRHGRAKKHHKTKNRGLSKCPQKQGVCVKVDIRKPKKPNSGERKVARVCLSSGQEVNCLIPGEGHKLSQHSIVLVRGGRVKDLPGVNYHCVRGTRDLTGIPGRINGRSKYGTKKARKKPGNQTPTTQTE